MVIHKILNNNVVISLDAHGKETVIMGRGIGFQKKPGDALEPEKIEKRFTAQSEVIDPRYLELLRELSHSTLLAAELIFEIANAQFQSPLSVSVRVALTDHIHFSIERHKLGQDISNSLLPEIKRLYSEEFELGLQALAIIEKRCGVNLPVDEAGFIALHLATGRMNQDMPATMAIAGITRDIAKIVGKGLNLVFDEEALSYQRFMTHLKFFAHRLLNRNYLSREDESLFWVVRNQYRQAYACTQQIFQYVEVEHGYSMTTEEMLFLTIHIERIRKEHLGEPPVSPVTV